MIDAKCKICRRAGKKLFLKGEKCFTPKCVFEKKPYAPGMPDSARKHRKTFTEYGIQLREKQKVKNVYRLNERQFSNYVKDAVSKHGADPADLLYKNLESRLDSIVFRTGIAQSRSLARQIVSHGHIMVNGRRVNIPSYKLKQGEVFAVRDGSRGKSVFADVAAQMEKAASVPWIKIDPAKAQGIMQGEPSFDKETEIFNLVPVLEFYSR